jgi:UDP-glucose 4-epimerase
MKRILITGANSFIGMSFENYMKQYGSEYHIDTIDMVDGTWRSKSFAGYDAVYHVAGLAHVKERRENSHQYYAINRDLPINVAKEAKAEGVRQFIFLSSMSVYGTDTGIITRETKPRPKSNYGKSKLEAELGLQTLSDPAFKVAILRPPMVYGRRCKGNYQSLAKMARKLPVFPKINNCRSMLYIENLCAFVKLMVEHNEEGIFWPQNKEYSNTSEMVCMIGAAHGKRIHLTRFLNWGVSLARLFTGLADKAFGSLAYEQNMSNYSKGEYQTITLEESIKRTES